MNITVGGARLTGSMTALRRSALDRLSGLRSKGPKALIIGVTGGIGSGKSSLTAVLSQCGATVADADIIAREIVEPGTPALREIHVRFGSSVMDGDTLNRQKLGKIVFSDPQALADLNAITHPRIRARAAQILASTPSGHVGIYDAAVLLEAGMASMVDGVIVVTAPPRQRLTRLVERGMTRDHARQRIAHQMKDSERLAHADIHFDNAGSLGDLRACGVKLYEVLLEQAHSIRTFHG
ncbi:MAG: dephospho-CoA kinase [Actinomycetaceae bacterium]|nr:dephospho-CoA kinase [Actinomycetaceae bacterium]